MELGWIMGFFFVGVTFLFVVIAFFFPEWVGITGKKAQKTIAEHQDSNHQKTNSASKD